MALGLTQPLTEISTRNIPWGVQAARTYDWQPHHLQVWTALKSGSPNLLELSGSLETCTGSTVPCLSVHITQGFTTLLHNGLKKNKTSEPSILFTSDSATEWKSNFDEDLKMKQLRSHVSCLAVAHKDRISSFPATATELKKHLKITINSW